MYTFTFNLALPTNITLQQAQEFFDAMNAAVNPVVIDLEERFDFAAETSTYVLDANDVPVV